MADWALDLLDGIGVYLIVFSAVVGALAVGYAIYLGLLLAKAEDEGKRKQAKSRMVKTLAGLFIIVILATTLFNPMFYEAVLRGTTDRGERVTISGAPINANNRYEVAVGRTIALSVDYAWGLNFNEMDVHIIQPNAGGGNESVIRLLRPASIQTVQANNISHIAVAEIDTETGKVNVTGITVGDAQIRITLLRGIGTAQTFRFPLTVIPSAEWLAKYPYAIRFHANEGLFARQVDRTATETLFGLSGAHKLTYEELMNIKVGTSIHNDVSRISRTWHQRISWTSQAALALAYNATSTTSGGAEAVYNMSIGAIEADTRFARNTDADGIIIFDVHALWRDTRHPDFGFRGSPIIPPPPPVLTPPPPPPLPPYPGTGWELPNSSDGGRTWIFNDGSGTKFGETFEALYGDGSPIPLPPQPAPGQPGDWRGHHGGNDRDPSWYQPTAWEMVMFSRFLTTMAYPTWGVPVSTGIAEVVMRRVMSADWRGANAHPQNSIYDVIMGLHPTFEQDYALLRLYHGDYNTREILKASALVSAEAIRNVMGGGTAATVHPTTKKGAYHFYIRVGRYSLLPTFNGGLPLNSPIPDPINDPIPDPYWTDVVNLFTTTTWGSPFTAVVFFNSNTTGNHWLHDWHRGTPNIVAVANRDGTVTTRAGSGVIRVMF